MGITVQAANRMWKDCKSTAMELQSDRRKYCTFYIAHYKPEGHKYE